MVSLYQTQFSKVLRDIFQNGYQIVLMSVSFNTFDSIKTFII